MALSDERATNVKKRRKRSWTTIFLPIFGVIVLGVSVAFAVVLAEPIYGFLQDQMDLPSGEDTLLYASGAGVFLISIMLFSAVYALLIPKGPKNVSEQALGKEKLEKQQEIERRKKMQKQMRAKMRKANRQGRS